MQIRRGITVAGGPVFLLALVLYGCSSEAPSVSDLTVNSRLDSWPPHCVSGGKVHWVGQQWKEGCNTCRCKKHGEVNCSKLACDAGVAMELSPVRCDTSKVGKMCTKAGAECGPQGICLLTGKVAGKEVGVCTCECVYDEVGLPTNPPTYVCPGTLHWRCGYWEEKAAGKMKRYCFKPCEPKLGISTCDGELACVPGSGARLGMWGKAYCLRPGCTVDLDCPVITDKACSVAKKDCPAGQRCIARVTGLDAGLCAKPGKCDTKSGLCDEHSQGKSTAKVGDPCEDDTQCAGYMTCWMAFDESKLLQKAGGPCTADDHCCSGSCTNKTCAVGASCATLDRNGYCAIMGCAFAKTYTIQACDSGSECSYRYSGGICLKTCDLTQASTCRGFPKDRLGDYECRNWSALAAGGKAFTKAAVCEPGYLLRCNWLKPPAGSSSTLSCAALGTWSGTTNDNKTKMSCRDLTGAVLKNKYDPLGLCLDETASGKAP